MVNAMQQVNATIVTNHGMVTIAISLARKTARLKIVIAKQVRVLADA